MGKLQYPNCRYRSTGLKGNQILMLNFSLLLKFGMLSVNQLNAQVKLDDYPLKIERQSTQSNGVSTRADSRGKPIRVGKSLLTQKSCISDAIHLWNMAPESIITSSSLYQAKIEIKKYARQLPL